MSELVKSPCRKCDRRKEFPGCDNTCDILDQVQKILADDKARNYLPAGSGAEDGYQLPESRHTNLGLGCKRTIR